MAEGPLRNSGSVVWPAVGEHLLSVAAGEVCGYRVHTALERSRRKEEEDESEQQVDYSGPWTHRPTSLHSFKPLNPDS